MIGALELIKIIDGIGLSFPYSIVTQGYSVSDDNHNDHHLRAKSTIS